MVFAVSVLPQCGTAFAFEVDGRGIEEHQFQFTEQITPAIEECFFEGIFAAAGRKGRRVLLLVQRSGFPEPAHRAISVVQFDMLGAGNLVVLLPHQHTGAIAPTAKETVQDGQKEDAFDG